MLATRVRDFAEESGLSTDVEIFGKFLCLLVDIGSAGSATNSTSCGESSNTCSDIETEVDTNICCFATGKLYTEALLGVGVSRERRNLATACELLSKEAFEGGLRQSTNKSPFEFFLPVWINEAHAARRPEWCNALKKSYMEIGAKVF